MKLISVIHQHGLIRSFKTAERAEAYMFAHAEENPKLYIHHQWIVTTENNGYPLTFRSHIGCLPYAVADNFGFFLEAAHVPHGSCHVKEASLTWLRYPYQQTVRLDVRLAGTRLGERSLQWNIGIVEPEEYPGDGTVPTLAGSEYRFGYVDD